MNYIYICGAHFKAAQCTWRLYFSIKKYILHFQKYISSIVQIYKSVCGAHWRKAAAVLAHRKLIPGAAKSNNANCFILQEILYKFSTAIININFTVCHTHNFTAFPLLHLVALDFYFPQELRQQLKFHALHKSLRATVSKLRMWKCTNLCMDNAGERARQMYQRMHPPRPDFTPSFGGNWCHIRPLAGAACNTPLLWTSLAPALAAIVE